MVARIIKADLYADSEWLEDFATGVPKTEYSNCLIIQFKGKII